MTPNHDYSEIAKSLELSFTLHSFRSSFHTLGATKKMCVRKIKRENGAKSYFRTCQTYFKSKLAENLEVIILRKLTKINIQKFCI